VSETTGEVEVEEGVLVIRRIHVRLHLKAAPEHRETAERVHGFFKDKCPVYRSLKAAIEMTTELAFEEATG
jgi:organic hydroperoxide reductase OsmC/OhrA